MISKFNFFEQDSLISSQTLVLDTVDQTLLHSWDVF